MKKIFLVFGLLLSLAACRSFEEAPIIEKQNDLSESSSDNENFVLFATIGADSTKVSLGADGYKTVWDKGDKISVYYSYTDNNGTSYALADMTLSSGEGTTSGTFTGSITTKALTDFTPLFAYYPAYSNLTVSSSTSSFSNLTFDGNIIQNDSKANIAEGIIKATAKFSNWSPATKGEDTAYTLSTTCNFTVLGTLLDFKITPTSELDGDVLQKISFTAASTKIAGTYNLSYNADTKAVSISGTSTSDADKTVTITFDGTKPVFKQNTATEVLMTVLPYVQAHESVIINVVTDKHEITVKGKAAKSYQPGTKYSMTIDLNTVSDNIIIVKADTFSQIKDKLGKFRCDAEGSWHSVLSDDNTAVQYGYSGNVCRLQNWDEGTITFFIFPENADFSTGKEFSLMEKTLTTAEQSVEVEVVWKDGNKYWLETTDGNTGYILIKED